MYGREDALKLNDVVEIVGVLSRVPEQARTQMDLAKEGQERQLDFMEEEAAAIPPTSLVISFHRHFSSSGMCNLTARTSCGCIQTSYCLHTMTQSQCIDLKRVEHHADNFIVMNDPTHECGLYAGAEDSCPHNCQAHRRRGSAAHHLQRQPAAAGAGG